MMNFLSATEDSSVSFRNGQALMDISETMQDEMPDWGYEAAAAVLFLIGFFGFSLNLFVIILMCKDIQIWTPMNIVLLNLVCSDFSVSIIGNPFTLASALNHGWLFGDNVCVAYGFFMSLLEQEAITIYNRMFSSALIPGITSITTLTVLSYERYCLVSCPFSTSHLTCRGAKISVAFIWLYSLALTSPPLFGWGKYVSEAANISCSINWESQTYNATSYIVFLFVFGLLVPVNVVLFSYIKIIRTMKENSFRSGRVNKVESRVTSMIFVMIIAFLIAWTPYSIFALSEQFGDPDLITPSLAVLPALIAKSSICYNPMIYVGMNSQFRAAWRRVCGKETPQGNVNETTINQISDSSSSRVVIECSFTNFEKKKKRLKEKHVELTNLNDNKIQTTNETLKDENVENSKLISNKIGTQVFNSPSMVNKVIEFSEKIPERHAILFATSIKRDENNYELRMFSSEADIYGKAINKIIRANSYKSNIC